MKYISHRGNLRGAIPERENHPQYIKEAMSNQFDVEIDLWAFDGKFYLGHDEPQYQIQESFLLDFSTYLWIHCKNLDALKFVARRSWTHHSIHYFWHEKDRYALTSHHWVISYPGKDAFTPHGVCMLPEKHKSLQEIPVYLLQQSFTAVCSDYIEDIQILNR